MLALVAKILLIFAKVILIVVMMTLGIRAHYLNSKRITTVTCLFAYYILIMLALVIYEFLYDYIIVMYYIIIASAIGQNV